MLKDFYGADITTKFMTEPVEKVSNNPDSILIRNSLNDDKKQEEIKAQSREKTVVAIENINNKNNSEVLPIERAIIDMFSAKEI